MTLIAESSRSSKVVKFAVSTKSKSTIIKKKKVYALKHHLLTEAHEQEKKFTSAIGETYTATRRVEKEQNFYLENNKGIAVVCQPHKGELAPHSEVIITVTTYNNVCGKYEDQLISEVKGLPEVSVPITIAIKGSPITIPSNQVGVYFNEDPPALVMKPSVKNSGNVSKSFKIKNTGIQDIEIEWKIFDLQEIVSKNSSDLFSLFIAKNEGNSRDPYRVELEAVEPEQESVNSPFTVTPKKSIVTPKGKFTYEITFDTSHSLGRSNSVILAHPHLAHNESKENTGPNLGVICLSLRGETLEPHLTVDKKKRKDNNSYQQFEVWPVNLEDAASLTKKISLTNETFADLIFNMSLTGSFELVETITNAPVHPLAKSSSSSKYLLMFSLGVKKPGVVTLFNLLPGSFVDAMCKMIKPNPNNLDEWPIVLKTIKKGSLTLSYANGSVEQLILEANLLRSFVTIHIKNAKKNELAEDEYDFGTVYIGNIKIK